MVLQQVHRLQQMKPQRLRAEIENDSAWMSMNPVAIQVSDVRGIKGEGLTYDND